MVSNTEEATMCGAKTQKTCKQGKYEAQGFASKQHPEKMKGAASPPPPRMAALSEWQADACSSASLQTWKTEIEKALPVTQGKG